MMKQSMKSVMTMALMLLFVSVNGTVNAQPQKELTEEMVSPLPDVEYNGEAQKPEVIIFDGDYQLEYGKDFWAAYPDSVNAGRSRCEIHGKGNYTGQITRYYTIEQADFNVDIAAIPDQDATGKPIEPQLTVTFKNTNNNVITVDASDYIADYSNNTNAGTATVILSSADKNFKVGLTQTKIFKINAIEDYLSIKDGDAFLSKLRVTNGNTFDIKEHYQVVCPEDIPAANLTWTFKNECVSVDNGLITAEGYGNAEIVLSYAGDGKYALCNYTFYVDAAPKTPTISLPAGAYPSDQDAITITKENVAGMAISYTWDDITGDNAATWKNYTDEGVVFQEGTLSARVGYTPAAGGGIIYSDTVSVAYNVIVDPELKYMLGGTSVTTATWTLGKEDNTLPVLQNTHGVAVTYESDNTAVATVANDGTVTVVGIGTAKITATSAATDEYAASEAYYTLTINRQLNVSFSASNTWATYCGTENLSTPEGLKAYQVTAVEGATVTISEIGYIPANTAVLLQNVSNNNTWSNIPASAYTGATSTFENNKLIGTASAVDVSTITGGTVYILVNNMFRRSTSGSIPANRGYLVVATSSNAPQLSISIGDENTTAISNTDFTDNTDKAGEWYSIDGVKLNGQPQKPGLYIKNGKKVFINKK